MQVVGEEPRELEAMLQALRTAGLRRKIFLCLRYRQQQHSCAPLMLKAPFLLVIPMKTVLTAEQYRHTIVTSPGIIEVIPILYLKIF
jgi:hypothetical protein